MAADLPQGSAAAPAPAPDILTPTLSTAWLAATDEVRPGYHLIGMVECPELDIAHASLLFVPSRNRIVLALPSGLHVAANVEQMLHSLHELMEGQAELASLDVLDRMAGVTR